MCSMPWQAASLWRRCLQHCHAQQAVDLRRLLQMQHMAISAPHSGLHKSRAT
jgi:hypothetical protein